MISPKEIELGEKVFLIHKIPAIPAREIITQYPISGMPKVGDYKTNEEIMLKMMAYVAVKPAEGNPIFLKTKELVNNHVESWEDLARLEAAMIEYNCSFFQNGKASTFFAAISEKVPALILKMLTDLQAQSSVKAEQPSKN